MPHHEPPATQHVLVVDSLYRVCGERCADSRARTSATLRHSVSRSRIAGCVGVLRHDPDEKTMMLTKQERQDIRRLIWQAPNDIAYMRPFVDDPKLPFTRGICDRHDEMARYLSFILQTCELQIGADGPVEPSPRASP